MTAAMISRTAPRKKKVGRYVVNDILGGRLRIAGGLLPSCARDPSPAATGEGSRSGSLNAPTYMTPSLSSQYSTTDDIISAAAPSRMRF